MSENIQDKKEEVSGVEEKTKTQGEKEGEMCEKFVEVMD